jgi:transposase
MTEDYTIAAGLDIHKRFLIATVLHTNGVKIQQRFERTMQGILALKDWILVNKCQVVACESTSDYWVHIYDLLCDHLEVIIGNPHDMKVLSHKKTDKIDSEIIALLALKGMIKPSRVFPRIHRDFRKIVRLRHFLVRKRTDIKNRVHGILDSELFQLSNVLTDIFGKSGVKIMQGILDGKSPDEVLQSIHARVRDKKESEIRQLLEQNLSIYALLQLRHCLRVMKQLDDEIELLTSTACQFAMEKYPREFEILYSVPGIGEVSAFTLLAEIGNFKDFPSGDKLASWLGIVPRVYQSAEHNAKRSITKRGSRLARWILIQVAHAAAKKKDSVFFDFYEGKKDIIGKGKAAVAIARKIITIVWHLIVNDEVYEDKYAKHKKPLKVKTIRIPVSYTIEDAIKLFTEAVEALKRPDPELI